MSKRGCQSIIQCGWLKAPRKSLLWGRVDTIAMATNCDSPTDSTIDHHPSFPPISLPLQFLQTELHEGSEKSQRFHETDLEITSEDLWKSWHENQGVCVTLQTGCSCRHITWTCFPPFPSSLSFLLSLPFSLQPFQFPSLSSPSPPLHLPLLLLFSSSPALPTSLASPLPLLPSLLPHPLSPNPTLPLSLAFTPGWLPEPLPALPGKTAAVLPLKGGQKRGCSPCRCI